MHLFLYVLNKATGEGLRTKSYIFFKKKTHKKKMEFASKEELLQHAFFTQNLPEMTELLKHFPFSSNYLGLIVNEAIEQFLKYKNDIYLQMLIELRKVHANFNVRIYVNDIPMFPLQYVIFILSRNNDTDFRLFKLLLENGSVATKGLPTNTYIIQHGGVELMQMIIDSIQGSAVPGVKRQLGQCKKF